MAKKSSSPRATSRRKSTSAADSLRGFSLQTTRFLYHLMKAAPGDVVSLEYFEDVGVEHPDGKRIAEQDKSYLSQNPLTDRAVAFWRSLRNWVDACRSGVLDATVTQFVIYAPGASAGPLATLFHQAASLDQASAALKSTRIALKQGDAWDVADAVKEHIEAVFVADQLLVAQIITRLSIDSAKDDAHASLKPLFHDKLVGEDSFGVVITWAHGWVKEQVDRLLAGRQQVRIEKKDFHARLLTFVRTHDRVNMLHSVAATIDDDQVSVELAVRNYVKQLRAIGLDDSDILAAVNDFLIASVDRTTWSEQGLISTVSLESLERDLLAVWRNKSRRTSLAFPNHTETDQGQLTYVDCLDHTARVDGLETPSTFIRGSWHALADDLEIGWHPRYREIMAAMSGGSDADAGGR